ncbi:aldolase/citrate lyase family protein [Roseibacterium sp. SDUM158017]|uniref:HpcH/HpaI aldolase family protein n=1 Tax=Roseicyclus salinarum TaxID=3036773 RepID=UPI0024157BFA|nr:aldolase/citrate lyase family protein [Roseibacterium sp. SDUM158017]MDG4647897.1 aldolase/citrate lyase family protein [Roseibacterium sp. SDUM158017]
MALSVNPLNDLWSKGRCALNGWIASPGPITAEAMAGAGWDVLTVDLQHGCVDYSDLQTLFPIIEKSGAVPFARVPWLDEGQIMRVLDAGAMGVIVPMIETAEQARRLVKACRYPPHGGRSFGPIRARYSWPGEYSVEAANASVVALAMIETRSGVEALDEILSVPGLSGIYIGPSDLALSYGYPARFDPEVPELVDLLALVRKKTADFSLRCGLHCGTVDYAIRAAGWKMDLVTVGSDTRFVEASAKEVVQSYRGAW